MKFFRDIFFPCIFVSWAVYFSLEEKLYGLLSIMIGLIFTVAINSKGKFE